LVLRLLLLSGAAAVLPALLISWMFQSISSSALAETISLQQTEIAHRIADAINDEVRTAQGAIALVAESSFFSAGSRVDQYESLWSLVNRVPAFQEVMFVNLAGEELLKVQRGGGPLRLSRRPDNIRSAFIGAPFFAGNRSPTILLGHPIRSFANRSRTGAIVAKMSFMSLGALLSEAQVGPGGVAFIVNEKGTLLAHPDEKLVLAHTNWANRPVVQAWLQNPKEPTILTESYSENRLAYESVAYPIPLLRSAVVVQQPKSAVYAPLQKMRRQFVLWTVVSLIILIPFTIWVAWRITHPLRQLRQAAEKVGQGERDLRLNIHTHDELEDLASTFEGMAASLGQLERMRNDLVSMIVHDLKMPLSTMMATLDSLLMGDCGPLVKGQTQFVQIARRSGQEMLLLIMNLLDVAKMEEGKLTLMKEPFAPRGWAENVISSFKPVAESGQKRLRLVEGDDLGPVEGDIPLLARVLANLISNALRHTRPVTGEVEVSIYREGTFLAVRVRDNGEGIPEQDQKHIFEKFVQGDGRRASVRTGVGLGLTFCKMIVEAHGGRISVYSQPGEGSLFTLHLPMRETLGKSPAEEPFVAALSTDKVG